MSFYDKYSVTVNSKKHVEFADIPDIFYIHKWYSTLVFFTDKSFCWLLLKKDQETAQIRLTNRKYIQTLFVIEIDFQFLMQRFWFHVTVISLTCFW